jgi:mersacidin/lichenicidin family type 2 lantibiotic
MSQQDIIRAWKDRSYRESLSQEQRSMLPENPAGTIELSDVDQAIIAGGKGNGTGTGQGTGGNCTQTDGCGPLKTSIVIVGCWN